MSRIGQRRNILKRCPPPINKNNQTSKRLLSERVGKFYLKRVYPANRKHRQIMIDAYISVTQEHQKPTLKKRLGYFKKYKKYLK